MKIVFFGEDSFSNVVLQSLINDNHNIRLVVSPFYKNEIHKRLENTCKGNNIEYVRIPNLKDNSFINKIRTINPELIVITHFERLLSKNIIDIPSKGCINLHPSLLPKYRGLAPQHWPIINGDTETGVTVHYVDETADTGDIIIQKKISIEKDMYVSDLQKEFLKVYKTIVVEAIKLINDVNFEPKIQRHLKGNYYGKLKREQCEIDLSKTTQATMNLIKAVSMPYYGAFIDDIIIWKAHIAAKNEKSRTQPNKIGLLFNKEIGYYLNLKDGVIVIDKFKKINTDETKNN